MTFEWPSWVHPLPFPFPELHNICTKCIRWSRPRRRPPGRSSGRIPPSWRWPRSSCCPLWSRPRHRPCCGRWCRGSRSIQSRHRIIMSIYVLSFLNIHISFLRYPNTTLLDTKYLYKWPCPYVRLSVRIKVKILTYILYIHKLS